MVLFKDSEILSDVCKELTVKGFTYFGYIVTLFELIQLLIKKQTVWNLFLVDEAQSIVD